MSTSASTGPWDITAGYVPEVMNLTLKEFIVLLVIGIVTVFTVVVCVLLFICNFCLPAVFAHACSCLAYLVCCPCRVISWMCSTNEESPPAKMKIRVKPKAKQTKPNFENYGYESV